MRCVSFVNRLRFEGCGSVLHGALTLGDVDNDGDHELVIGNTSGQLMIYKGQSGQPWKQTTGLGMITSVTIGDILNKNYNVMVVISGDGWCYIYDFNYKAAPYDVSKETSDIAADCKKLTPFHRQRIPANVKVALIEDIDKDGANELVLGLTDRIVRSYRWLLLPEGHDTEFNGALLAQNKWELPAQIGNITINTSSNGEQYLMVAQPGGTYMSLKFSQSEEGQALHPEFHPLEVSRQRSSEISTEVVGNIRHPGKKSNSSNRYAIALLDGTLALLEDDQIIWSLMVDHQLFGLTKMDFTGDGSEEVVACSYYGMTYIVDHETRVLRFQFDEPPSAFVAGKYSTTVGKQGISFVYATFGGDIYLYYDISVSRIGASNLIEAMEKKEIAELLDMLHIDSGSTKELVQLYRSCLYGFHEDCGMACTKNEDSG